MWTDQSHKQRRTTDLGGRFLNSMTHLSDFSYLDRGISDFFLLLWSLVIVYSRTGFNQLLQPSKMRKLNLKSLVTLLLFLSMIFSVIYDTLGTYIKYEEGFYDDVELGIITKPKSKFSQANYDLIFTVDMMFNITCAFKTSSMFLLMAYWHAITHKLGSSAASHFTKSNEFRFYSVYSCISIILYPSLQFIFVHDELHSVVIPQFLYNFEVVVIAILSQLCNVRFVKLLNSLGSRATSSIARIKYYMRLNNLLTVACLLDCAPLFAINMDIVLHDSSDRLIYHKKFWSDALTAVFNVGFSLTYVIIILTVFPPPEIEQGDKRPSREYRGQQEDQPQHAYQSGSVARRATNPKSRLQ